jgi:hypothetical protein
VRRRKRRSASAGEGVSLSFLDAVSCGFGAIVMLLVLTKIGEPQALERARQDLDGRVADLQRELARIRGEIPVLERRLRSRREQLSHEEELVARLRGDLSRIRGEFASTRQLSQVQEILEGRLLAAQQELSEEMKRLLGESYRRPQEDATIGGIPVDSEYVIFVIDTSPSMFGYAWPAVLRKMEQVLDVYPTVKGIQVMNDMGQYMFSSYAGKWIPDTPGRRRLILSTLRNWNVFSNSSPVEGVRRAIVNFAAPDKKVSIYVFGDEYTGDSIQAVLDEVAKYNSRDQAGKAKVRIHGVGFPVVFTAAGVSPYTGVRFATLMRVLCHQNGGTFVGLNSIEP